MTNKEVTAEQAKQEVLKVYPEAHEYFDGETYWVWGTTEIPKTCLATGKTSNAAWISAYTRLQSTAPVEAASVANVKDGSIMNAFVGGPLLQAAGDGGEERQRSVPLEIVHVLWYEGGRLRTNLKASLDMHPDNWHEEGAKQRLEKWDQAAERYFDFALSPKAASPETEPVAVAEQKHEPIACRDHSDAWIECTCGWGRFGTNGEDWLEHVSKAAVKEGAIPQPSTQSATEQAESGDGLPPLEDGWTNGDYWEFLCAIGVDEEVQDAYRLNISDSVIEHVARRESIIRQREAQVKASLLREKELKGLLKSAVIVAQDAYTAWNHDQDMKCGKILLALAGSNKGYRADTDAIHAATGE